MISARMSGLAKILLLSIAAIAVAAITAACGTERIAVSKSNPVYAGAVLFSQRCSGCHTLSYAATHGSAPNIRTAQANSGPNFNVRCERPVTRVLYAIENGGFSGAYMPQNVVVGQDAIDVAKFVATYSGRASPREIGIPQCQSKPIGPIPAGTGQPVPAGTAQPVATTAGSAPTTTTTATTPASSATVPAAQTPVGSANKVPTKKASANKRSRKK
jgi:mono/diheme cytochrome c family protein